MKLASCDASRTSPAPAHRWVATPSRWTGRDSIRPNALFDELLGKSLCETRRCRLSSSAAKRAKEIELAGWDYPRHLEGRVFSVIAHGDVEGAENVRRSLVDWLSYMHLTPAGTLAELDRYIGYWKPYATGHAELDADHAIQDEVRNAARCLIEAVVAARGGRMISAGANLKEPRLK